MTQSKSVALVLSAFIAIVGTSAKESNVQAVRPTIITRSEWGARASKSGAANLSVNPPPFVIVHHSASGGCTSRAICQAKVRSFQDYHMDVKKWEDIGYNFLVGEDGNIYEGRGWGVKGAHSVKYNAKSIGICIIGTFTTNEMGWRDYGSSQRAHLIGWIKTINNDSEVQDSKKWQRAFLLDITSRIYPDGIDLHPWDTLQFFHECLILEFSQWRLPCNDDREPNLAAVSAIKNLMDYGVSVGNISSSYIMYGHKQTSATDCPGTKLYEMIQSWPHWQRN